MGGGGASGARVRMVSQPGSGPGTARNRGASEARGEVLVFLDDDCAPDPAWLDELDLALAARPGAGVGGRTVNALPGNPYSSASQALIDYLYEYYNREAAKEPMFTTSNLALPREEFERIGGFDQRFSRAGGEDRELCLRWARSGRELRYAPRAIVRHAHRLGLRSFLRQHFTYGRGAARFHRIRESTPIPEPASSLSGAGPLPVAGAATRKGADVGPLALSQMANVAGYAWSCGRARAGCRPSRATSPSHLRSPHRTRDPRSRPATTPRIPADSSRGAPASATTFSPPLMRSHEVATNRPVPPTMANTVARMPARIRATAGLDQRALFADTGCPALIAASPPAGRSCGRRSDGGAELLPPDQPLMARASSQPKVNPPRAAPKSSIPAPASSPRTQQVLAEKREHASRIGRLVQQGDRGGQEQAHPEDDPYGRANASGS